MFVIITVFVLIWQMSEMTFSEDEHGDALEAFERLMTYFGMTGKEGESFPDYYGGCKLDSGNVLIIYLTRMDKDLLDDLNRVLDYEHVVYEKVQYAYNDFDYVDKIIFDNWQWLYQEHKIQLVSTSFDIELNRQTITVKDLDAGKVKIIKHLIKTEEVILINKPSSMIYSQHKDFEVFMNQIKRLYPIINLTYEVPSLRSLGYAYDLYLKAIESRAETVGIIIDIDLDKRRILVESDMKTNTWDSTTTWFSINDSTVIRDKNYETYNFDNLKKGMSVLAYTSDPVILTRPGQALSDLIVIDSQD